MQSTDLLSLCSADYLGRYKSEVNRACVSTYGTTKSEIVSLVLLTNGLQAKQM